MQEQLAQDAPEDQLAQMDADIAQMGLEFTRLIPVLLEAFGGMVEN